MQQLSDFGQALAAHVKLVAKKRPISVPAALLTLLSIVDEARSPRSQIVVAPVDWLLIAMGCAMLGQFLVWRDSWYAPADPEHAAVLRGMAEQAKRQGLPSLKTQPVLKAAFDVHFPQVNALLGELYDAQKEINAAESEFGRVVTATGNARFTESDGWGPDVTTKHFMRQLGYNTLLAPSPPKFGLSISNRDTALILGGSVVWKGEDPSRRIEEVIAWVKEMYESSQADAVRAAYRARLDRGAELTAGLDLVIHRPIRKVQGCAICNPPRQS